MAFLRRELSVVALLCGLLPAFLSVQACCARKEIRPADGPAPPAADNGVRAGAEVTATVPHAETFGTPDDNAVGDDSQKAAPRVIPIGKRPPAGAPIPPENPR